MRLSFAIFCLCASASATLYLGGSGNGDAASAKAIIESGASHVRVYLMWGFVEPRIKGPLDPSITVANVEANPSLISSWAALQNWKELDRRMGLYANSTIKIIGEVGEGTNTGLPRFNDSFFDPNVVGETAYLGYLYRSTRAIVRRYKDRVALFQIENELNEAWLASIAGQRKFQFFGSLWRKWDFLTLLLQTLRSAVKAEAPSAPVTMNFHTDVAKWVHDTLLLDGFYENAVQKWAPLLDVISLDAYPNAVVAAPCQSAVIGDRVKKAIAASSGKSVFIMETGYPVYGGANQSGLPEVANFTNFNQEQCINASLNAVRASGGKGFMYFKFAESPGIVAPPGGFSALDLEALKLIKLVMTHDENVLYLLEWLSGGLHLDYLEDRLPALLQGFLGGTGLLQMDGTPRPAYETIKKLFASWT